MVGLQLLRDQGRPYGSEQVFTYGPWGFLSAPTILDLGDVWIAGIFRASVLVLLFLGVYFSLSTSAWRMPIAIVLTLLLGNSGQAGWLLTLALAAGVLAHLASSRTPPTWLLVAAAVLSALALQIKLSDGVLSLAVVGLLTLSTRRPGVWILTVVSFWLGFFAWWLLAGQSVGNAGPWLRLSADIVSGYGEGLAFTSTSWIVWIMVVGTAITGVMVILSRLPLVARVGALGIVLFVTRAALTRPDGPHVLLGYGGLVVVLAVTLVHPLPRPMRLVAVPTATVLALLLMVAMPILPPRHWSPQTLPLDAFPAEHARRIDQVRAALIQELNIDDELVTQLRGHPVSIDPWEISAAWAYELDWSPLPVFQSYSAYTPRLDEANAAALLADLDHRVLRESVAYDDTNALWTTPRYTIALMCNFEEVVADSHWSVLARVGKRCGSEERVSSARVSAGQPVELPRPIRSLVALRFFPDERSLADRLVGGALGYQRNLLHATVGGTTYRLPEALAGGPLIVGAPSEEPVLFDLESASSISFDRAGLLEVIEIPLVTTLAG